MAAQEIQGHPVVIIGAGRGGTALLEMFTADNLVTVIAIADTNPEAPGLQLAKTFGIPTFTDPIQALQAGKTCPDCIVYNLSHDESIAEKANQIFGDKRVTGGPEVKLFWQMVTNLKQTKGELEKSQNQLQSIIRNVMDGIITINSHGEVQGFNPAAEKIFGYSQQEIFGKSVGLLMPKSFRTEHDGHIHRYLKTGESRTMGVSAREVAAIRKNGEQFPAEIAISEMILGGQQYFVGILRDITERKQTEQKIAHMAHHDFLTGLPNRVSFMNALEHSIRLAKRHHQKVAVLFLDLDGFKQVNDTLGHDVGDLLLQSVAKRLKEVIRDSDTTARVGGDEFTFVLNDIGSAESATLVAKKIINVLSEPFELQGHQCRIGGSVGISIFPDDSENLEQLIKQSDEAMYLAKHSGKNTFKRYQDVLQKRSAK